jgi:hypothetical protein
MDSVSGFTDVLIASISDDAAKALQVAQAISLAGWTVRRIHSAGSSKLHDFDAALAAAKCVLLVWSEDTINSEPMRTLASRSRHRVPLIFVRIARYPVLFRDAPTVELWGWSGAADDPTLQPLIDNIAAVVPKATRERPNADASTARTPEQSLDSQGQDDTARLFLCYRREDTQDAAGRLHDRLIGAYGSGRVFMDIDSVPLGADFVEHVTTQIARCSAVVVMIGKRWLTIKDRKRRRLDYEDDLVRAEVRAALQKSIPVIPIVVQNASMPRADDLPEDIRPLARRNGIQLRPDHWKEGVDRLLKELDKVMKASS